VRPRAEPNAIPCCPRPRSTDAGEPAKSGGGSSTPSESLSTRKPGIRFVKPSNRAFWSVPRSARTAVFQQKSLRRPHMMITPNHSTCDGCAGRAICCGTTIDQKLPGMSILYYQKGRRMPYRDPERKRESDRTYVERNREQINARKAAWARAHPETYQRWYQENKAHRQEYKRQWSYKYKLQVLLHYGGNPPQCACCKESMIGFLTVEHQNGTGKDHRANIKVGAEGGQLIYRWLVVNNYPEGFEILCANCNLARGWYGACPHTDPSIGDPRPAKNHKI
jgi:hypothetical protein